MSLENINRFTARKLGEVRLVGKGSNEIVSAVEAFERADSLGLDLILVSKDVTPPVVRIQDQNKIEYEKKKARKASKQTSSMKEVQFKINISDHDLSTKISHIEKFLARGDKVKISVRLKGRERDHPQRARELVQKVVDSCKAKASFMSGPIAMAMLEPIKHKVQKK
jgi:translation initiation factor IF-3